MTATKGTDKADLIGGYNEASNRVESGDGNDTVGGSILNDTLDGGLGDDSLSGSRGDDRILGGAGDDSASGDEGNDTLVGGIGNDYLAGGFGSDTYVLSKGDGVDRILADHPNSEGSISEIETIEFADATSSEVHAFRVGHDLVLKYGANDQAIVLNHFHSQASRADRHKIDRIRFSDGVTWDRSIIDNLAVTPGTDGNDTITGYDYATNRIHTGDGNDSITGGALSDELSGAAGNDVVSGAAGNDTLIGGIGNDTLEGGANSDTYLLSKGDGSDRITAEHWSENENESITFKDVAAAELRSIERVGNDLVIRYGVSDDITVLNHFHSQEDHARRHQLDQIKFSDGVTWNKDEINKRAVTRGSDGKDTITGVGYEANTILAGAGNDSVTGGALSDTVFGGSGNDSLSGSGGNDELYGMENDDVLHGDLGNDTLVGGTGNDTLRGGAGADNYVFSKGDGADSIIDGGEAGMADVVSFADVASTDVTSIKRVDDNLVLSYGSGDELTILSHYATSAANKIEEVRFSDGIIWDKNDLEQLSRITYGTVNDDPALLPAGFDNHVIALAGNDFITIKGPQNYLVEGGAGIDLSQAAEAYAAAANTLAGGRGNDRIIGGKSADTYLFSRGDGQDRILDADIASGSADRIVFGAGITLSHLKLSRSGNDLVVLVADPANPGANDQIVIESWFASLVDGKNQIERFEFMDGTATTAAQITRMGNVIGGSAGADLITLPSTGAVTAAGAGDDVVNYTGSADNVINGGAGNDVIQRQSGSAVEYNAVNTFTGGTGNDTITGGASSDTYRFNRGDGIDVIYDNDLNNATTDQIVFGSGITMADISWDRSGDDMVIRIANPGKASDQITIAGWFPKEGSSTSSRCQIEKFLFNDGSMVSKAQFVTTLPHPVLTNETPIVNFYGGAGDDTLRYLGAGGTQILGGAGNDTIEVGPLAWGSALNGGAGNDRIVTRGSKDTYVYGRGDGQDTILDYGITGDGREDRISFGGNIRAADLIVEKVGEHLRVTLRDANGNRSADQITIENWFSNPDCRIEAFAFASGGPLLMTDQITQLAMRQQGQVGLENTDAANLGQITVGGSGERISLNTINGNVVVRDIDDSLKTSGLDIGLVRTYNSYSTRANPWEFGVGRSVRTAKPGAVPVRLNGDGSESVYELVAGSLYRSVDGQGGYDTLAYDATAQTWTWTDGASGVVETYAGADGRLLTASDLQGNLTSYDYNGAKQLEAIRSANGEKMSFVYNTAGDLEYVSSSFTLDGGSRTSTRVRYAYDELHRLTRVTTDHSPDDNKIDDGDTYWTVYQYELNSNRITSIAQKDGSKLSLTYQRDPASGRYAVASTTDGLNRTMRFARDASGNTTEDPFGHKVRYTYNNLAQVESVTDLATNQTTRLFYDAKGNVSRTVDARGVATEFRYDANGNQTMRIVDGVVITERTFGTVPGQLLRETTFASGNQGADGALTTRMVYDAKGRLRFQLSPEGRVTEYRYNAAADNKAKDEPASRLVFSGSLYDLAGLEPASIPALATMEAWAGGALKSGAVLTDYRYDARGLLAMTIAYNTLDVFGTGIGPGAVERYTYDQTGLLLQTIDANGRALSRSYDGLGHLLHTSDSKTGKQTLTTYDDGGHRTVSTNYLSTTTAIYDRGGQLVQSETTGPGVAGLTSYTYDGNGRLRMVQSPTGQRNFIQYDAAGRKLAEIDADGSVSEYFYTAGDQVARIKRYANRIDPATLVDSNGQVRQLTLQRAPATGDATPPVADPAKDRSSWLFYDNRARLVDTVDAFGYVTHNAYDGASRLIAVVARSTPVDLSQLGGTSVAQIASPDDRATRLFYDADGNKTGQLDAEGYLSEMRYSAGGQLRETLVYKDPSPAAARAAGSLADLRPAGQRLAAGSVYLYNARGLQVAAIDGEGYLTETRYDGNGNVAATVRYATAVKPGPGATLDSLRPAPSGDDRLWTYTYTPKNQVEVANGPGGTVMRYQYDRLGNVISTTSAIGNAAGHTAQSRYDGAGRLVAELATDQVAKLSGKETAAELDAFWRANATTHAYDAAGNRISSTDALGGRTLFYYDADGRLSHTVNAAGEVRAQRFNGFNQVQESFQLALAIDPFKLASLSGGQNIAAFARLVEGLRSAADSVQRFDYDGRGQVIHQTDALGNHTVTAYDGFGAVSEQRALAKSGESAIDAGRDSVVRTVYDKNGRVAAQINGVGGLSAISYDANGNVSARINYANPVDAGLSAAQIRDGIASGRFADPAGADQQQRFVYDGRGLLSATLTAFKGSGADQQWSLSTRTYDSAGRLIASMSYATPIASGASVENVAASDTDMESRFAYDAAGRLAVTASAQQRSGGVPAWSLSSREYDVNGNVMVSRTLATQLKASNPSAQALLDAVQPASQTRADAVVRYVYDEANRVLATATAQGPAADGVVQWSVSRNTYDKIGRLEKRTDLATFLRTESVPGTAIASWLDSAQPDAAADRNSTFGYDALHRLVSTTNADGTVSELLYDTKGNVVRKQTTAIVNQLRVVHTSSTVYDLNNRPVFNVDVMGGVTENRYDTLGNVIATVSYATPLGATLAPGATVEQVRKLVTPKVDPANTAPPAPVLDRSAQFVYDAAGRLRFAIDAGGYVTESRYDAMGRVKATLAYKTPLALPTSSVERELAAQMAAQEGDARINSATYNAKGNVVSRTDGLKQTEYFGYDALGRKTEHKNKLGRVTDYEYNAVGQLTVERTPAVNVVDNNQVASSVRLETRIAYDAFGQVAARTEAANVPAYARTTSYEYDLAGRQVKTHLPIVAVYDAASDARPSVSNLNRVETTPGTAPTITVSYDAMGNAVKNVDVLGNVTRKVYDKLGRVRYDIDALGYITGREFDAFGNVTKLTRFAEPASAREHTLAQLSAALLGRAAQPAELVEWTAALGTGSKATLAQAMLNRPEVQGLFSPSATNRDFIVTLFVVTLGRQPDDEGLKFYLKMMEGQGVTRGDVVASFIDGIRTQPDLARFEDKVNAGLYPNGTRPDADFSIAGVEKQLALRDHAADRSIVTVYDAVGHATQVVESASFVYDVLGAGSAAQLGSGVMSKVTLTAYNRFGEAIRQRVYGGDGTTQRTVGSDTRLYYDLRGNNTATFTTANTAASLAASRAGVTGVAGDVGGYLTEMQYDDGGRLVGKREYAELASEKAGWGDHLYAALGTSVNDRVVAYEFDDNGQKAAETRLGVIVDGGSPLLADGARAGKRSDQVCL
ncbi:DUF4214 domain-containing protein [Massilia sp. CCM 8733]|uniref:DUF4214 domain-containing protein n=1 Tax=Massilia mucilaginosa TaxID=2609282 RepID=A0ABX0NXZ7_9BURK|nr:calcium-binding protein [Massilia mucilaginosa]NHZ91664.1 DUF4214 domain-containing protein [Massilia mucilaginosa]